MKSNNFIFGVITFVLLISSYINAQYPGWTVYTTANSGSGTDTTFSTFIDSQGEYWFATVNGVSRFDGETWTLINSSNSPLYNYIFMYGIEQIGDTMYFAYYDGVYKHYNDIWELIPVNKAKVLKRDGLNNLWIGTDGNGLVKYSAGQLTTYTKYNSPLRSNRITDLEIDLQQNLWISMIDSVQYGNIAGVAKYDGANWTVFHSQNSGLINENITQIAIDRDENFWFGGDSLYLYKYDNQNWSYINLEEYSSNWINGLDVDSSNIVWAGVDNYGYGQGVYKYDGTTLTNYTSSNSGLPDNMINDIKVDDQNNKWIGTWNGLAKFDDASRITILAPNGNEVIQSLTNLNITWTYQFINQIDINFSTDGGNSWNSIASGINPSNNIYSWNVPVVAPQSDQCKIRIVDSSNPDVFDESDNFFTVYAKVATPSISPAAGVYNNNQTITMSTATTGSTIFYTLDGTEPDQTSTQYTGGFVLNFSATVKAKAFKTDWVNSDTRTNVYELSVAGLNFQPGPGSFSTPLTVTINSITDSTEIFYTLDGTDPTQSSNLYQGPVSIDETKTLKARGYRDGYTTSQIKTGVYTIMNQVITPVITTPDNWIDADYNGFEIREVNGSNSTISYGTIESYLWYVNDDSVDSGPIVNLKLFSGTSEIKLKLIGDRGVTAEITKDVHVYSASLQTSGPIYSGVGQLNENTFFVTSFDDKVYQFDSTANSQWSILTGGDIQSTTCISDDNKIYVGSSDTRLYCFDEFGIPVWDRAMGGVIVSSPSADGDSTIYVGVSTGRLFAVSNSSTIRWSIQTGGSIESSPSIGLDGTVYVGSVDGKMYAVNQAGSIKWNYQTGGQIISSPAIANDSSIIFGSADGKLYKLNSQGNLVWLFNADAAINSSPIIADGGKIIFGSNNGNIYCLDADGIIEWQYSTSGPINSSPAISASGEIYIGNDSGDVYIVNLNGEYIWKFKTGNQIKTPIMVNDRDLIIFGNSAGKVYILKVPDLVSQRSSYVHEWPTFKGNNRRTGNKLNVITGLSDQKEKLPTEYSISQNYPNPFNPTTNISYSVPRESRVRIIVYDILGNEISVLVDEEKPAGYYEVDWNANNIPSGIYIYRIQSSSFVESKKMVLVK